MTHGVFTWPDGSEYVGDFNGFAFEGQGILNSDFWVVKGEWRNSKLHGKGERKSAEGEIYKGKWI